MVSLPGQSDIRKLRRENEQLRREIWSLRDEYDRLDQILRHDKQQSGDSGTTSSSKHHKSSHRGGGGGEDRGCCDEEEQGEEEEDEDEECCSCNQSEGGCEECDSGDNYCDDEDCNCCGAEGGGDPTTCDTKREGGAAAAAAATAAAKSSPEAGAATMVMPVSAMSSSTSAQRLTNGTSTNGSSSAKSREHLHVNFDHLSIVSEENLTGSDGSNSAHNLPADAVDHHHHNHNHNISSLTVPAAKDGKDPKAAAAACHSSSSSYKPFMSLPATPCSPLLTDFQSLVPPLTHFENINYDDIKPLPSSSYSCTRASLFPSVRSQLIAQANASSAQAKAALAVSSASAADLLTHAAATSPAVAVDVPSVAPSPEPPDSPSSSSSPITPPSSSTTPPLPICSVVAASSISSSDWVANNKTVSFSTFRPQIPDSASQWSLSKALERHEPSQARVGVLVPISPKPKHFFSPLRSPKPHHHLPSSPDLYVHDVLASPSGSSYSLDDPTVTTTVVVMEPIYTTIHKSRPSYHHPLHSIACSPVIGGAIENPLYAASASAAAAAGGSYTCPIAGGPAATGGRGVMVVDANDGVHNHHVAKCSTRSPTAFRVSR